MKGLPPRAGLVLAYICASLRERGYAPSVREIAKHLGVTGLNGVVGHLRRLESKGYIVCSLMESRAIRVLRTDDGRPIVLGVSETERAIVLAAHRKHFPAVPPSVTASEVA